MADTAYLRALGARIRTERKRQGLTLRAVEERTAGEFKQSALGSYEKGVKEIGVSRLNRLATVLGVTASDLLPARSEDAPDPRTIAVHLRRFASVLEGSNR